MAFYKCPNCATFFTQKWPLLKGHMKSRHDRADLEEASAEAFSEFEISEEDYNRLTGKGGPELKVETGSLSGGQKVETTLENQGGAPVKVTESRAPEIITEYVGEPVARLRQVLIVNDADTKKVQTMTNIMQLSPWLWGNPYQLEEMLVSHFGSSKRAWAQQCVAQYMAGVDLPEEVRRMSPYSLGMGMQPTNIPYGYPNPYQPHLGGFGAPGPSPEVADLRAELARLREERQREHEQTLLNRIAELEKKMEGGGQVAVLLDKIKDLETRLATAGQPSSMTIYDEKGNPMVLPYDRSYMVALNRKQEAETDAIKMAQMIELLKGRGDSNDKYTPMLEALKKEQETANKKVEELTKLLADQRIAHLEERVKAAEELALNSGGEGKGILELASEAGADLKEGAATAMKEVKDSVEHGVDTIKEVLTNRPAAAVLPTPRSPQEIADIMESENTFLTAIGEQ